MPQHSPLLHLPQFPGTPTPSQTHPLFAGPGFAEVPSSGAPEWFPGWVWGCSLSPSALGAANVLRVLKIKPRIQTWSISFDSHSDTPGMNVSIMFGVCWNVNFESRFSQSIIISSLSESKNFLEREGLISVTVFKQFELGSFCKTIISFLLSQLNFAWG